MAKEKWESLADRIEGLLARVEQLLPPPASPPDFRHHHAFRWRNRNGRGQLVPVAHPHAIRFDDLIGIDAQKERLIANTRHFVEGRPANNVLLTGARGTGKSSLVKAALHQFARKKLRLIEVDKSDLVHLADIVDLLEDRDERFIIFCDDLSFEANDPGYKSLKVALDGSIAAASENMLIYATSNRRHLMPEQMSENLEAQHTEQGEIHPGETTEEKISLSERFGLWLSFYPFTQDEYLRVVGHWVSVLAPGRQDAAMTRTALQWSLERGSRTGRVAFQFAKDWAARHTKTHSKASATTPRKEK
ncbi:MAG: ATP-binding protein [Betaproteobacteria bacterium]|nr:ATP-binding protein [Betaproteobacteria bacterium]